MTPATESATTESTRRDIVRIVHEVITSILPAISVSDIQGDRHIKDLGADSVDRVEIILSILDRLDLDEPMASFSSLPNIDALVFFLCEKKGY